VAVHPHCSVSKSLFWGLVCGPRGWEIQRGLLVRQPSTTLATLCDWLLLLCGQCAPAQALCLHLQAFRALVMPSC
jgi:hypothetical protein